MSRDPKIKAKKKNEIIPDSITPIWLQLEEKGIIEPRIVLEEYQVSSPKERKLRELKGEWDRLSIPRKRFLLKKLRPSLSQSEIKAYAKMLARDYRLEPVFNEIVELQEDNK